MPHRFAYVRVAIASEPNRRGYVRAFTVNERMEAFDGAGFSPGMVQVHKDAIVEAPIELHIEPCQLMYGGKKLNRINPS